MSDITFKEMINKTNDLIKEFEKVEQRKWGIEGNMIELSKQIGELAQNVMMIEKYYFSQRDGDPEYNKASKEEIADELSDILFLIIRIARHYKIDLEKYHLRALKEAHESIK